MQIPIIKKIAEKYTAAELQKAEEALLEELTPEIEIEGKDEGEKLTHIMAALWVKEEMEKNGLPVGKAVRNYTVKVRNSIS